LRFAYPPYGLRALAGLPNPALVAPLASGGAVFGFGLGSGE
jgi:hypothetical protein